MKTEASIRLEIKGLMMDLSGNGFEVRRIQRSIYPSTTRLLELMTARMEIYKSICHRQALLIEIKNNEIRFAA